MTINTEPITTALLVLLLICAVAIIFTNKLIHAVIFMSTFSTIAALVFLFIGAPDVALAEVVIGSTLSTIIFLIAIKKYKLFVVYIVNDEDRDEAVIANIKTIIKKLEKYLKAEERQIHIIKTEDDVTALLNIEEQKVIIESNGGDITVHVNCDSTHSEEIMNLVEDTNRNTHINIECNKGHYEVPYKEGAE